VLGISEIEVVTSLACEEALLLVFLEEALLLALELGSDESGSEDGSDEGRRDSSEAGAITAIMEETALFGSLLCLFTEKTDCPLPVSEVSAIEPPVISTAPNTTRMIFNPVFISLFFLPCRFVCASRGIPDICGRRHKTRK